MAAGEFIERGKSEMLRLRRGGNCAILQEVIFLFVYVEGRSGCSRFGAGGIVMILASMACMHSPMRNNETSQS